MKSLYLTFTDAEFKKLKKARVLTTYPNWEKFIINACSKGISARRKSK